MAANAPQQIVVNVKDGKAVVPASLAGARIEIVDVDLVFVLPDGTKIVLPGLGLQALSGNPPIVEFTDAKMSAKDLLGRVGDVRSLKDNEQVDLTSLQSSIPQGKPEAGAVETPAPRAPAPPPPATPSADARMSAAQAEQAAQQAAADVKRAAAKGAAQAEMATPIAPAVVAPPPGSSNSGVGSDSAEPKLPATSFAFSAAETTQGGAKIGSLFETGSTYLGKVAFTLAGKSAEMFVIDQATGVISLAPGAKLDYETATTHLIQAIAQGGGIKPTAIEILVSVVDVNEAPAAPAFVWGGSIKENSATGVSVGQVAAADPEGAATVTYELLDDGGGRFAIDAKTGLVTVKDGAKLDFEKGVEHAIVVKATDLGGLTSSATLNVKVLDVNEAPTAPELVSGGTVAENSKAGTAVLSVRASDQDAGDAITFSLVNDFGGRLTIDAATGAVTVAKGAVINFETDPKLNVVVRASDKAGLHSDSAFVVKVTDVNEAPSDIKILSQVQLTEGAKAGASAAKIESIDPDANDIVRYSIEKDESGRFAIDASTGEVTVTGDAKFDVSKQSQFPIVVRATDKAGLFSEKELTISVLATSNVPINPDALIFKAKENIEAGSVIGKIPTVGSSISEFAFKDSADGRFTIDSKTGEIRLAGGVSLDYETAPAYNLEALLTATTGPLILKIIVGVEDVNEAPSAPAFVFGGLVADGAANGVNVGIVKAADPDANDKIKYQLLDDAGGRFAIDSTTGVVSVLDGTRIDYESAKTYDIVVRATDRNGAADGLSASAALKIIVDDINERPVLEGIQPVTIKENLAPFTTIATAKATDADVGDSITYSMVNDAGGLFAIDAKTGVIRVAGGAEVNYESLGADGATLTLTVRATDVAGLHDERDVTVVVEDVAEAPRTISFQQASPLPENSAAGVVVGKAVATDDDAGSVLTYSLDPAGSAGFAIDEATGEIRVSGGAKLDFETGATISLKVVATDETNLSKTATISIALADVNEAPTTLSLQGGRVMAGASDLGRLVGVDPDKGDELKYALTDNPGGLFQVDATTGLLTLAPGANPVLSAYRITATATDKSNLSITNSFDLAFRTTNTAPSAIELSTVSAP
ncbi:MAG: cadherin repeat domain-containing protein, partial [Alphaproteobacteria bacterium]|nr:cadherin repeat domain-containing protein [Alphaproteobacteria bacterium]